jgi:signal transduction histidine kinase/ActR/RegA family two-component response regulator
MKLQTRLFKLVLAAVLPLVVLAIVAGVFLVRNERESIERYAIGITRAAMSAVDAQLRGSISTIEALAASQALARGDIREFHKEAQRVLATQPGWLNIGLATRDKIQLFDAIRPFGEHVPFGGDGEIFETVVRTGKPVIGDVRLGAAVPTPSVRIRYPIIQNGEVRYVLSVPHSPSLFDAILRAQELPEGWVIVIADRNKRFIARLPAQPVGASVSEDFRKAIDSAPNGFLRGRTVEGFETYTPYLTSSLSGWVLGVAIPAHVVEAGMWRAIWTLATGVGVALILGFGLAWSIARTITRPVGALAAATEAVARGETVMADPPAPIDEVVILHRSLRDASVAVRQREESAKREREALAREKEALSKADRAKDEFLAMLSHELRNPLAALTAAAHLLKVSKDEASTEAARAAIERQTRQMSRLVGDLLDLSSITMGKVVLEREDLNLADVVNRSIEPWRTSGRLENRRLMVQADPVWVNADRARVEQIVTNFMDNAVKFTPAGGRIDLHVGEENGMALLAVRDDGRGFMPEIAEQLFEMFFQFEPGVARTKSGMGIGLALVRRLVELHGGSVSATSAGPDRGAQFTVRLPSVSAPSMVLRKGVPAAKSKLTMLVVDDNSDAREMLATLLTLMGHSVTQAGDGLATLEAAAQGGGPDVAFIDIGLPDMDGYEVARRLRLTEHGRQIILIALTGYGQFQDRQRAEEAGFDLHLTKPVDADVLESVLNQVSAHVIASDDTPKKLRAGRT